MLNNLIMSREGFTPEEREEFNKWCEQFEVSTRWDPDKPKNREFIEKYDMAQYAIATGYTEEEKVIVDHEPSLKEKMVDIVSHILKIK